LRVEKFKKLLWKTEIHSKECTTLGRISYNVSVMYEEGELYYGRVEKFYKVYYYGIHKIARVSMYYPKNITNFGQIRLKEDRIYATGRMINADAIHEKVILQKRTEEPNTLYVLPVHTPTSQS